MAWSLDWFSAAELARAATPVRRVGWEDHWLGYHRGLWWILAHDAEPRIVEATDIGEADLLARDWTDLPVGSDLCGSTPAFNTTGRTYRTWTDQPVFTPPPVPGIPEPDDE